VKVITKGDTMKISYAQAFNAAPILNTLSARPLSAGLAIKLVDIVELLNPHLIAIERFRDGLATSVEKKSSKKTQEELGGQFTEYLNTTTVDLGSFVPLFPEEADAVGLAFTMREMGAIRFMFAPPVNTRTNQ